MMDQVVDGKIVLHYANADWIGVLVKLGVVPPLPGGGSENGQSVNHRHPLQCCYRLELEAGVEGLIHVSEMSWSKRIKHPSEVLKKGDVVEASLDEAPLVERSRA